MHRFTQKAFASLLGLCMASAMASSPDPAFNAFMQQTVGNKTTVSFAGNGTPLVSSSAPLGQPSVGQFGVSRTSQGVFMESIGAARVPGTNSTIPVKGRIQLSGQAIGRTLAKASLLYAGWELGSALYDIWQPFGLQNDAGTILQTQTLQNDSTLNAFCIGNISNVGKVVTNTSANLSCTWAYAFGSCGPTIPSGFGNWVS